MSYYLIIKHLNEIDNKTLRIQKINYYNVMQYIEITKVL